MAMTNLVLLKVPCVTPLLFKLFAVHVLWLFIKKFFLAEVLLKLCNSDKHLVIFTHLTHFPIICRLPSAIQNSYFRQQIYISASVIWHTNQHFHLLFISPDNVTTLSWFKNKQNTFLQNTPPQQHIQVCFVQFFCVPHTIQLRVWRIVQVI